MSRLSVEYVAGHRLKETREQAIARFWSYVRKTETCWLWEGALNGGGYGSFGYDGANLGAHEFADELVNGPRPKGVWVLHSCDVRRCVRNDSDSHLWRGNAVDNWDDMRAKGRNVIGSARKLAKLTEADVLEMRQRHAEGALIRELAPSYGVAWSVARRAIAGITWKHVAMPVPYKRHPGGAHRA